MPKKKRGSKTFQKSSKKFLDKEMQSYGKGKAQSGRSRKKVKSR